MYVGHENYIYIPIRTEPYRKYKKKLQSRWPQHFVKCLSRSYGVGQVSSTKEDKLCKSCTTIITTLFKVLR